MQFRVSQTSWVTLQTVFTQAFGVAVLAIQAPLLGPHAFGLVAIVTLFTGFCELVLHDVTAEALISLREIDDRHYAVATTVNGIIGLTIGAALFLAAPLLASAYGEPSLRPLFRTLSVLPLISGIAAAPNALSKREMNFKILAIRMITGVVCGGVVGVVLAVTGAGVWALVWQAIVQRAVAAGVLWGISDLKFRVRLSSRHLRDLSPYMSAFFVSRTMSSGSALLPRMILSVFLTATDLGLFSLASRFSDLIIQSILIPRYAVARVSMRAFLGDAAGANAAVGNLVGRMGLLCFPACLGGAALAPLLIRVWLDPKWYGAIVPAQLLLLSTAAFVSVYGGGAALVALNEQKLDALLSTLHAAAIAVAALVFWPYGLIIVTLALAVRPYLLIPVQAVLLARRCGVRYRTFLGGQGKPLLSAGASALCIWSIEGATDAWLGMFKSLLLLAGLGLALYIVMVGALQTRLLSGMLARAGLQRVNSDRSSAG